MANINDQLGDTIASAVNEGNAPLRIRIARLEQASGIDPLAVVKANIKMLEAKPELSEGEVRYLIAARARLKLERAPLE